MASFVPVALFGQHAWEEVKLAIRVISSTFSIWSGHKSTNFHVVGCAFSYQDARDNSSNIIPVGQQAKVFHVPKDEGLCMRSSRCEARTGAKAKPLKANFNHVVRKLPLRGIQCQRFLAKLLNIDFHVVLQICTCETRWS